MTFKFDLKLKGKNGDCITLLNQLRSGRYDDVVREPGASPWTGGFMYPHLVTLQHYLQTPELDLRNCWAECLDHLRGLSAPMNDDGHNAAWLFSEWNWNNGVESTARLFQVYVDAGYVDVNEPLPGHIRCETPKGVVSTRGYTFLAAAICNGRPEVARAVLHAGADMDIGPIHNNGARCEALEYAQECGNPEVTAVVAEFIMRRHVSPTSSSDSAGAAPRRRRMGV
jgi:hypothetical protein